MSFLEMYALTPRAFFNAVNGYRKQQDNRSKQQWIMTRKLMYAVMKPYLNAGIDETDIQPFAWEENQIKEMTAERAAKILEETEITKRFWEDQDRKNAEKKAELL